MDSGFHWNQAKGSLLGLEKSRSVNREKTALGLFQPGACPVHMPVAHILKCSNRHKKGGIKKRERERCHTWETWLWEHLFAAGKAVKLSSHSKSAKVPLDGNVQKAHRHGCVHTGKREKAGATTAGLSQALSGEGRWRSSVEVKCGAFNWPGPALVRQKR